MNLISINKPGSSSVIMVHYPIGSRFELENIKGISHFLEHICFKGSKKYNHKEISGKIENVGGVLNAYTDNEQTCYWAKVGNRYKDIVKDILLDMSQNPTIPEAEVEKEREVIIQEMKMYQDSPDSEAADIANKLLFSTRSGFYENIVGTKETLSGIKKKQLENFQKAYYKNSSFEPTLILVGDFPNESNLGEAPRATEGDVTTGRCSLKTKKIEQAHVIMTGYVNFGASMDCLMANVDILDSIYSDMSGRLFTIIREKYNMVYGVHFGWDVFSCGGIQWNVSLGLEKKNIDRARNLILKELQRPVTKKEVETAIQKSVGQFDLKMDSAYNVTNYVSKLLTLNQDPIRALKTYTDRLNATRKTIGEIQKSLQFNKYVMAGVIPE